MTVVRFGEQPARDELRRQRWTAAAAARELGVEQRHLTNVLSGKVRPSPAILEGLPRLLRKPAKKLFTESALARPYQANRIPYRNHPRKAVSLHAEDGDRLRAEYAAGGVTQRQLAEKYGITKSMVSRVINRERWV